MSRTKAAARARIHPPPRTAKRVAADAGARARAVEAHRAGRLAEAAAAYDALLARGPDDCELLHRRGVAAGQLGDPWCAVACLERAHALSPHSGEIARNLALALRAVGRLADAQAAASRATTLEPADADSWRALGEIHHVQNEPAPAADAFARAVALAPGDLAARTNLAIALKELGRLDDAERELARVLDAAPHDAVAINASGTVREARGDLAGAGERFARALDADPGYADALFNLAAVVRRTAGDAAAVALLRDADAMAPSARTRWALSIILLGAGDFAQGWRLFDEGIGHDACRPPARPYAIRRASEGIRRARLWGEQGIGEEVLFSSMIPDLLARGIGGVLECDPRLVTLFARSFPGFDVVARRPEGDERARDGEFELSLPTASLGGWLRPEFASFPRRPRHLVHDQAKAAALRARYRAGGDGLLVGISWLSGARKLGLSKSMDLASWGPILATPGARFLSLQYGPARGMLDRARAALGAEILEDRELDAVRDLDAFAAQVAAMDVVVTASNSTAHFAGALGVPCLVLAPRGPGALWHWFDGREDSPWYASITLIRQREPGDWRQPVADAARRIAALAAAGRAA